MLTLQQIVDILHSGGIIMKYLKELRLKKGVSQQVVADYLGITNQAYSLYELGKRQADYETQLKLAEYFDVPLDYLFRGDVYSAPVSDEKLKVALFGGDSEVTDDMWDEVKRFAEFVKEKNKGGNN